MSSPPMDGAGPRFGPGAIPPFGGELGERGMGGPRPAQGAGVSRMGGPGGPGGGRTVPGTAGPAVTPEDVENHTGQPLYDSGTLRTLFLDFESTDWEAELVAFKDTDVEVPASVTVDGVEFENVGVHFRGMSSFRMVSDGSKRSLNLSFDFIDDDQRIEGYRTLNLLNAMGDPTMMRTALYSRIARDFIPAPDANFVQVVINGESWGIYTNVQQFNKDFLRDNFDTTDGARWKVPGSPNGRAGLEYLGDDVEAYRSLYEIKSRDDEESWNALIELTRILNETPVENLVDALEPILDIDGTLKFLAIDNALVNSDGYWVRASDYSLYRDLDGRFHVIPHDMNEGLGSSGSPTLDPLVGLDDTTKPLRSRLLAVPELRDWYLDYVEEIATEWLTWDALGPIVEQHRALIGDAVLEDTRKLYSSDDFEPAIDSLRTFIEQRREFLLQ